MRQLVLLLTFAALVSCVATYFALTRNTADINTVYIMLNVDLVLVLLLGTLVARHIVRLWGERKKGIAGAKLHTRFVVVFGLMAATPAVLMAVFSSVFFYFGMNAWFNERVKTAVLESLTVAQAYLKEHQQVMKADVLAMANDLDRESLTLMGNQELFNNIVQTQSMLRNLPEAIVFTADGRTMARSSLSLPLEMNEIPEKELEQARIGEVVLMTGGEDELGRIHALVKLDRYFDTYLYVGRLVDAKVLQHTETAQKAVQEYTTLEGRKSQLQLSMTLMFVAVALLLLAAAIWFGLRFSGQLVAPIGALILAAEKIRKGDLSARVPTASNDDEIGLLGIAFNRMTGQLERQQAELLLANGLLDERRRFTEAVLSGASSGVVGVDNDGIITLANAKAEELLADNSANGLLHDKLTRFIPEAEELLAKALTANDEDRLPPLQIEYTRGGEGPKRTLLIRITAEQGGAGAVATLDDISALVSAQRKAAWADVARRIAHEIKNPLTPIQLSAERLKRKYLPQIKDDPETFEKCTETIIRQVNDIGHMVTEFSSYARMPEAVKRSENLVEICQDALILQRQAHPDIGFGFIAGEPAIEVSADRAQVTQVITNLLLNAIDSIHERQQQRAGEGNIKIVIEQKAGVAVVIVEDNGLGLPEKEKHQLLEPYVTTKKKGSGLGLAIVRKIMEDHDGSVDLEDNLFQGIKSGAKAVIIFPKEQTK